MFEQFFYITEKWKWVSTKIRLKFLYTELWRNHVFFYFDWKIKMKTSIFRLDIQIRLQERGIIYLDKVKEKENEYQSMANVSANSSSSSDLLINFWLTWMPNKCLAYMTICLCCQFIFVANRGIFSDSNICIAMYQFSISRVDHERWDDKNFHGLKV